MNTLLHNLDPTIAYALGWTIIHSLWQASLIALIMSLMHKFGRAKSASFKYGVSVLSMLSVFLISTVTFVYYFTGNSESSIIGANSLVTKIALTNETVPSFGDNVKLFFSENLENINIIWSVGVILFLLRFILSYAYTKYLKSSAIYGNEVLNSILRNVCSGLSINKNITIGESAQINIPMVLGHFKPLILFPIGMVNELTTDEVEAIITHELGHVKRLDYLANIIMTIVEILFYFHPAVWWISANIKAERENCCDDFALAHRIDKVVYAKALVKLEELKSTSIPSLAMPFSSKKHQLLNRIKRIMNMPQTQNDIREKSIATVLLLSMVFLFSYQANSETPQNIDIIDQTVPMETLTVEGKEEMVLRVKDGKFASLEVDKQIQKGELIDKIASSVNKNSTEKKSYTVTINERPTLTINRDKVSIRGNGGIIYQSDDEIETSKLHLDTIPNITKQIEVEDEEKESRISIATKVNGKVVEMDKENGKITKLIIDGKEVPPSEYDKYKSEIEEADKLSHFDGDFNIFKDFNEQDLSKSFGYIFDGENWREFGGNFNQLFNEEFNEELMEKLRKVEELEFDMRGLEHLKELERLGELKGLDQLRELEGLQKIEELEKLGELKGLEELENMGKIFEDMGIHFDTAFNNMHFDFDYTPNLEGFEILRNFEFDNNEINPFPKGKPYHRSGTVVDKMGEMLNSDGLLEEYKVNKVEITGKHLKINGEKMPKALFEKYKKIYQEATGAPLTKKSKMIFELEGKPSNRRIRTF